MDFVKALTYPFDDQDWLKKLGIAVALVFLNIIPIIGTFVMIFAISGWQLEIIKRVKRNDPEPLPGWDDFGALIGKGLTLVLASLVYQIPTLVLGCIAFVPFGLLPMMGNDDAMGAMAGMGSLLVTCCSCIIVIYAILAGIVYWGGLIRFVDREEFGTFMEFGENLALVRNNIGDFGMALVFIILGGLIAGLLSGTVIGGLVSTAFSTYFTGHILGQLAQKLSGASAPQV